MIVFVLDKRGGRTMNPGPLARIIDELPDGKTKIEFKPFKNRSLPQNSYYWGVVCPMVRDGLQNIGYSEVKSPEIAHEIMKTLFLPKRMVKNDFSNEEISIQGSTSVLTTLEFTAYIDEIARWCWEYLGFVLPMPNETIGFNYGS